MFRSKQAQNTALEAALRDALGGSDWIESARIRETGTAVLILKADPNDVEGTEARRLIAENAARSVKGVTDVQVILTSERTSPAPSLPTVQSTPARRRAAQRKTRLSDQAVREGQPRQSAQLAQVEGISRIIAVASAKGGVGKSTVAVNLAVALGRQGVSVGLLDADIYGPSVPVMLGLEDADPKATPDGKLEPVSAHGVTSLSIGYLTETDAPMIWRGPMVMSAITQMLNDAAWGAADKPLDVLIIDTPPGTGDAALTLAQRVPLDAAIIVTTPQTVALADVRRGLAMFNKTAVPVLGIVETMSWFEDPSGQRHDLFGSGGGRDMADAFGVPLLAELPILTDIREGGDLGRPAAAGTGPGAAAFAALANTVQSQLGELQAKPAPTILFED